VCGGGKTKTSTSSSSTSALPQYAQAYGQLLGQAQNVATTPYNPATNQQVAGFTNPQNQAFDATQANLGAYQPYLGEASSSLSQGTLTPGAIQSFMSPYTQNVVDATQAQFANENAQQAQSLNANAAKIGALTGDRSQVAQGVLAGQQQMAQAPVIAGLYNQGYQSAAQTAGQAAGLANQNAALASSIGGQAQQYGTNDIASLLGIGGLQQTQQQNVLNANTANAQAQAQYPFATTQWLASLETGLGGAAGSTSNGSQTTPGPNLFSQLLGLGLAGASLYGGKASGGRVGYDSGGVVLPYANARSYVPSSGIMHGGLNHQGAMPSLADNTQSNGMSDVLNNFKQAKSAFQGIGNLGSRAWNYANTSTDPNSDWSTTTTPSGLFGMGNYLGNMFGFAEGGTVRKGYEDGGDVTDLVDDGTGTFAPSGLMGAGVGLKPFAQNDDVPFAAWNQPSPVGAEDGSWAPSVTPANDVPAPSYLGASDVPAPQNTTPPAAPIATPYELPTTKGLFGLQLSEPARQGLLAAGLGMMASESPWVGTAIGQGGLAGVKTYDQARQQAVENTQSKQKIDLEAQRLAQTAKEAAERLKYEGQRTQFEGQRTASDVALQNTQRAGLQQALAQKQALIAAMKNDPSFIEQFKGTPYEGMARAAAAGGDFETLANLVEKMQPKVSGTMFVNPAAGVATDTLSGTSYDMRTGQMLPPKVESTPGGANGQPAAKFDPTQYGLPANAKVTDFFTSLPDAYRRKLANIYTGQDTLAGSSRGNAATLMRMQMDVQRAFPDYQPVDAQNRSTIVHSLADTKSPTSLYNQRKTLGTFAEHLAADDGALTAAKALPNGTVLAWNAARNEFNNQTGDPRLTALNTRLHFLQGELGKMVTNNVLTDREAQALEGQVSSASSPSQLRAAFDAYYALIKGRVQSVDNATQSAMGSVYDPNKHSVATPQTRALFQKFEADPWGHPGPPPAAIELLRANPDAVHKASFDKHFGAGAADKILSGAQ
jgi:hypothetical protein